MERGAAREEESSGSTADLPIDAGLERQWTGEDARDPQALGRYEIVGRLGKGAMGTVFEAVDPSSRDRVAIKMITRMSPEGVYRFKKEFRALARFQHRNVVSLYELSQDDDQLFYSMELVKGVDLLRYLCGPPVSVRPRRYRPCRDYALLRATLQELVTGVDAIHRAGILHRDIKPSNVLVDRSGRVVLLDFGLVRSHEFHDQPKGLTDDGAVLGTPLYMSPEQAAGKHIDPASDWYGVGIMLYHALCGSAPFQGTGVLALLAAKRDELPPRPAEVVPEIPTELEELCWDLVQTDPTQRPTGQEILERVGAIDTTDDIYASGSTPFLGRMNEVEALRSVVDGAQASRRPSVALVDGVSGMGKTALVQRFLGESARDPHTVVLAGKCSERESIPYKALDSVMDALSDYLRSLPSNADARALLPRDAQAVAKLFPVLMSVPAVALSPKLGKSGDRVDPTEQRRKAFDALRELFARLADDKRVVIYIDDLQWSDRDSCVLLESMLSHSDAPNLAFIASYRTDADKGDAPLARLVDSFDAEDVDVELHRLHVGPMTTVDAAELALRMLGNRDRKSKEMAAEVAKESEGSPFFVGEMVRYARRLERGEGESDSEGESLVSLDSVIRHRLSRLPSVARALLDVVAVAGGRVSLGVAVRVAMGDRPDRSAVARLRAEHLVRTHGPSEEDSVEIYHARIRETALKSIAVERLPEIHLAIGKALLAKGDADAVALSHHFRQAGEDQLATRHTIAAAEQAAAALAFDRAAELFEAALELRAMPEDEVPHLEARLADALANAGRLYESAKAYLRATDDGENRERFEWTRRAAEHLLSSGHGVEGRVVLDKVLRSVGLEVPKSNARAIGSLIKNRLALSVGGMKVKLRHFADIGRDEIERVDACWTAARGLLYTDGIAAADFHARSLRASLKAGEPVRIARALAFEGQMAVALSADKKLDKAQKLLEQASELAERVESPYARGMVKVFAGHVWISLGRWHDCARELDEAVELLRDNCNHVMPEIQYCQAHATVCFYFMGRIKELADRSKQLLQDAVRRANPYCEGFARGMLGNVVALAPDRLEEAREQLEIYRRDAPARFEAHALNCVAQCAALERYAGNFQRAYDLMREDSAKVDKLNVLRSPQAKAEWLCWRGFNALAGAVVSDQPDPLLSFALDAAGQLDKHPSEFGRGYGKVVRAGAVALKGDQEGAVSALRGAIELFTGRNMEGFAAVSQRRLAALVGGAEGEELRTTSDAYFEREGVKQPDRFTDMFAPGFVRA